MASKKNPSLSRQELEKLLLQLEQAPRQPEQADKDLHHFSPWNVSMKNPGTKRTISFSLSEDEDE